MSSELAAACPLPIDESERILMGHGSGGRLSAQLIERLLVPALSNPTLDRLDDQAVLPMPDGGGRLAFTTDSFVVSPIFFPGGDIGELAVNGTINDLAMGGARPLALSLALILEEGFAISDLRQVVASVAAAARAAGVRVVTGDTKVVGRGHGDQIFINTAGIGVVPPGVELSPRRVRPGDAVVVSGTMGDHGMAIMARRAGIELEGALVSDTAPLHGLAQALLEACPDTHAMRDPTRGGLAATLVEIASRCQLGIEIEEALVPLRDTVHGACELLGLDPFLAANEGKLVAFVPRASADRAVQTLRAHPLGRNAACIGCVVEDPRGLVVVETPIGGRRILDLPYAEPLPRIC